MSAVHNIDALPPRKLGRYVLRRELASGGMARVYLAQFESDGGFSRWVAVKVVHPHLAADRRFVDMLLDEARVTSQIHHPNVCAILDFGENEGEPHIVMEYIHGLAFSSVMQFGWPDGKLPFWLTARILADAARGLHAAHELKDASGTPIGIVHRDVSPQNIMVHYDGVSKILDFGIARARGRIVQTGSYEVKGKFTYMAPEQLEGREVDRRADVWALAVILWEATVGQHLFRGENDGQTTLNVITKQVPKPSDLVPGYPPELEKVVMAGLERDLDTRTQTAAEFADALDAYLWTLSLRTGPTQVSRWMRNAFANQRQKREKFMHTLVPGQVKAPAGPSAEFDGFDEEQRTEAAPWVEESGSRASSSTSPPPLPGSEAEFGNQAWLEELADEPRRKRRWGWLGLLALVVGGVALGIYLTQTPAPQAKAPIEAALPEPVQDNDRFEGARSTGDLKAPVAKPEPEPKPEPPATETPATETPAADKQAPATTKPTATRTKRTERRVRTKKQTSVKTSTVQKGTGYLNLLAIPAGEVYFGSRRLGKTPLIKYKLPVGTHKLKVKRGGKTTVVTVRITADKVTKRVIAPDTGD